MINKKVLVVSVCKEKFHELEFVKPIEDILKTSNINFVSINYLSATKKDLENCSKVIICGTSLQDFGYLNNLERFDWLRSFEKPVLGICAGMQILYLTFKGKKAVKLKQQREIGFRDVILRKNFFGLNDKLQAYFLHKIGVKKCSTFEILGATSSGISITKHKEKAIYGVLFHPEVRNREIVKNFCLE